MPRDDQWSRQSFITGTKNWINKSFVTTVNLEESDELNKNYSSAYFKFTDSSLGGNFCINPPAQFTRYADIRDSVINSSEGKYTSLEYKTGYGGMGRYYSEAIDDNSQVIHMRFGVPQYNSLTQFFVGGGFFNSHASNMARTGRVDSNIIETFFKAAESVLLVAMLPLLIIPIAIMGLGAAIRYFAKWPDSKFYYLKPAMPLYWKAVSNMVNQIGANKGIINYAGRVAQGDKLINEKYMFSDDQFSVMNSIFPGMSKSGMIDVYYIATRSKVIETEHRVLLQKMYEAYNEPGNEDPAKWFGIVKSYSDGVAGLTNDTVGGRRTKNTLESLVSRYIIEPLWGKSDPKKDSDTSGLELGIRQASEKQPQVEGASYKVRPETESFLESTFKASVANLAEGADWASFRVDYTGPTGESFQNTIGESTLAQKINDVSNTARNIKINFADGNIDSLGITKTIYDGLGAIVQGTANLLQIGGLAAFAGNAIVDIPKHWESASAILPRASYTLTLISPYGNPISQLFSIYMPLCMLLAGALPLATGKQSYTAPFLCELYDRGRSITRLGIIEQMSIQRGTANLGFNNQGEAMAIDVTFSIVDMSTILTMPISQGFSIFNPFEGLFDGENSFADYMMTLSSLSLRDSEQRLPILEKRIKHKVANIQQMFTPSSIGMKMANVPGVNLLGALFMGAGTRRGTMDTANP